MNIFANATSLPWAPSDLNDLISIVFVGPRKLRREDLEKLTPYVVRKPKIVSLLEYLRAHDVLYSSVPPPDQRVLDMYPEHGILPGLEDRIVYDHESDPKNMFADETSSFDQHPGELSDSNNILFERTGVYDPESNSISGRSLTSSALRSLAIASNSGPQVSVRYGDQAIPEYNNPDLFPGMFPTLFPLGIGGFEDHKRDPPVSLEIHARHLLDLSDRCFRYHYFYVFVALNLIQRRKAHLHTSFAVKSSRFASIAPALLSVRPQVLTSLANNLRDEYNPSLFTDEEKNALALLKEVNTISSKVPGSQASKVDARHDIRSYFSSFGLPTLFFTFNPSATHSPIFQVIFGYHDIDLDSNFPSVPDTRSARAQNVARDPVAGADFFDFMRMCLFRDLFGWDFNGAKSLPNGGIFGKLRSHYGVAELTGRGQFHGHWLIWLLGAHSPSEIHSMLKESDDYRQRFFAFFEDIIHHHLPPVDVDIDDSYEPRIELPPQLPPKDLDDPELLKAAKTMWTLEFDMQHKKIGERVQRHRCQAVCYKGRKDQSTCRFGFPQDIIETSTFEADTNSVVFRRLESDVNGHNPNLLVSTRHNHDLKCILSGKSARAAMFYISDYITKMPLSTEELLTLLSRAVASVTNDDIEDTPVGRAKRLLHRCLTHFGRGTQIHAQHAARLIQGVEDTMLSHKTVPMPSARLLLFVRTTYSSLISNELSILDNDVSVRISIDNDGRLRESNQVDDYYFRPSELEDITFFDFIRHFSLESKSKSAKNTPATRLGVLTRYPLCDGHVLSSTHELLRHTNPEQGDLGVELVPKVVGTKIPRQHSVDYKLFCLSHFKPFSVRKPLITQSVDEDFECYSFTAFSKKIMYNWEQIYECQDERERERLKKQAQGMRISSQESLAASIVPSFADDNDEDFDFIPSETVGQSSKQLAFERECLILRRNLSLARWLQPPNSVVKLAIQRGIASSPDIPRMTKQMESLWSEEIKQQTERIKQARLSKSVPSMQVMSLPPRDNQSNDLRSSNRVGSPSINDTTPDDPVFGPMSIEDIKVHVLTSFKLNVKQREAFEIICTSIINRHVLNLPYSVEEDALRLFLTGPGGTGKTHVVKAVKEVLKYFGLDHTIRFLAPTGTAANLIDGTTIHSGLGIAIKKDNHGFTHSKGDDTQEVYFAITNKTRTQLRADWKDVLILMIDEVSLLSLSLLAEIDAALRFVKESPDEFFGNLTMIFSGDQYQYPPSAGRALYTPLSTYGSKTAEEIMSRLGRFAWKSVNAVICLDEQKRMAGDPEYGAAVARLRTRQCIAADVALFNSRVIKSFDHPDGVTLDSEEQYLASMIVQTNKTRHLVNQWKTESVASGLDEHSPVKCAAQDTIVYAVDNRFPRGSEQNKPSPELQSNLLHLDMSSSSLNNALPGFINMYVGMPVVLKGRNINTILGVTNGARGSLKSIETSVDSNGFTYCTGGIVHFPDSKVHLQGLPPQCFPIKPTTWTCTTIVDIPNQGPTKIKIRRTQLPIQCGFAVTGHSAQGQTLLVVICNLKGGSWPAYVAASRAKTREGLFLTEPVTLHDLNSRAVPYHLWFETHRFEILEHNTRVTWGFISGERQVLPDIEGNDLQNYSVQRYRFSFPTTVAEKTTGGKRRTPDDGHPSSERSKRTRKV